MSGQATCTLWEALTELAFGNPIPAAMVPIALKDGRWGCTRAVALVRLAGALSILCDAGYRGDVSLWGKAENTSPEAGRWGPLRRLTQGECIEHRLFAPGEDSLGVGKNRGSEYDAAFDAHASRAGLGDVRVDRADLSKLLATHGGIGSAAVTPKGNSAPFTDAEIDAWIGSTSYTSMKKARNAFMEKPRAKGLSATFEAQWNAIKQNPVGRPPVR